MNSRHRLERVKDDPVSLSKETTTLPPVQDPDDTMEDEHLAPVLRLREAEDLLVAAHEEAKKHEVPVSEQRLQLAERRANRASKVAIAAVALLLVVTGALAAYFGPKLAAAQTAAQINQQSIDAQQQAIDALKAAGVPPDQIPAPIQPGPAQEVDVNAVIQAASAQVLAAIANDPRYRGVPGVPGIPGVAGAPCDPATNSACVGPEGQKGDKGDNGEKGDKGDTGDTGATGPAGSGCPEGTAPTQKTVLTPENPIDGETVTVCQ